MCAVATRPEVVGQLTLSELPDWPLVNARKMAKAVFLLLQTYHRSHGWGVVGCYRPVGAEYFYFYSHAARDSRGCAKYIGVEAHAGRVRTNSKLRLDG
jgi:hypothetical protein